MTVRIITRMSVASDQAILDALNSALLSIVGGTAASYTVLGKVYTSLDIEKLSTLINFYEAKIQRAGSGPFSVARTGAP